MHKKINFSLLVIKSRLESAVNVTDLLAALDGKDSVEAKVTGQINNVCQMKGCWMNISDDAATEPVFVQFKDYAFFVPKDAAGKEVVIEGVAYGINNGRRS